MVSLVQIARREVKCRRLHSAFIILQNECKMDWIKVKKLCIKWRKIDG